METEKPTENVEFDNLGFNDPESPPTNTPPEIKQAQPIKMEEKILCFKRSRECLCVFICTLFMFVVFAGVAMGLVIHYLAVVPGRSSGERGDDDGRTTTPAPPRIPHPSYGGSLIIDDSDYPWISHLANRNTPYYKLFTEAVKHQISSVMKVFPDPAIAEADIHILGFGEGSVFVSFEIQTSRELNNNTILPAENIQTHIIRYWDVKNYMKLKKEAVKITVKNVCEKTPECQRSPCANTRLGCVKGKYKSLNLGQGQVKVKQYLGVPFAAPPVGKLRFADPQPVKPWAGVKDATSQGAACILPLDTTYPKTFWPSEMWNPQGQRSEDCLHLNVYTPDGDKDLTVLVWIFGGGFYSRSNTLDVYDGSVLAASQNVVVVTLNYRLGSLGFLSTGDGRIKGNFGMKDQVLALQWIQDNIARFGGDPKSVTIFGESAGGVSVGMHIMSPMSQGLFKRAVINSGAPGARWGYMTSSQAAKRSEILLKKLNCKQKESDKLLECLRALNASKIGDNYNDHLLTDMMMFTWVPTIDGEFLTENPFEATRRQNFKTDVDLMIGFNKNEGNYWNMYRYAELTKDKAYCPLNETEFEAAARDALASFPRKIQNDVIKMYTNGVTTGNGRTEALDKIVGEFLSFSCPASLFANAFSASKSRNVFEYRLDYRASNEIWPTWMGVIHGADIQYFFGVPFNDVYMALHKKQHGLTDYNAVDKKIAMNIMNYFGSFAKTGKPVSAGVPDWPKYDTTKYESLRFTPQGTVEKYVMKEGKDCTALWRVQEADTCCSMSTENSYSSFGGSLEVEDNMFPWNDDLMNTNSPYFKIYSKTIIQQIRLTLSHHGDGGVRSAQVAVVGFSEGSVTVHFQITTRYQLQASDVDVAKQITKLMMASWAGYMKIDSVKVEPKTVCSSSTECKSKPCVDVDTGCTKGKLRDLDLDQGKVKVRQFLGIPFAKPPIGDLRFAAPRPAKSWDGVHDGTKYGPSCMMTKDTAYPNFWGAEMWNPPGSMSEDCLHINVFTPEGVTNAPVLVWIYGGGFYSGTSSLEVYDGSVLAATQKVVVVSMNYRVGILGYFSTGDGRIKGNFGMKDQRLALQWVQRNIAKFGGDPRLVTLFGESAGGSSVGYHLLSDTTNNLFKRGVMQSGTPIARWAFMSMDQSKRRSEVMLKKLNCTQTDREALLKCLRAIKAEKMAFNSFDWVVKNPMMFPWVPTVDGEYLKKNPVEMIEKGEFNKNPEILMTLNQNEGTYWNLYLFQSSCKISQATCPLTQADFTKAADALLMNFTSNARNQVIRQYSKGVTDDNGRTAALDKLNGEFLSFTCSSMEFAKQYTKKNKATYLGKLSYRAKNQPWPLWTGVIHGADVQWIFGLPLDKPYNDRLKTLHNIQPYTEAEKAFALKVMTYLGAFATHGNPNTDNLPKWPTYNNTDNKAIHFTSDMNITESPLAEKTACASYSQIMKQESCCGLY